MTTTTDTPKGGRDHGQPHTGRTAVTAENCAHGSGPS